MAAAGSRIQPFDGYLVLIYQAWVWGEGFPYFPNILTVLSLKKKKARINDSINLITKHKS